MHRTATVKLLRHAAQFRGTIVPLLGTDAPESASVVLGALDGETDAAVRLALYRGAVTECLVAGCLIAAERIAAAGHQALQDLLSLKLLSETLSDVGKPVEGLVLAKVVLDRALSERVLVNFSAGHLMRQAIKTGSVEAVDEALDALVGSTQMPRTSDCALETDWIEAANAIGANKNLTRWVQEVADGKHR